tara:strand:- start:199 stop:789 length:591 start_codon:yes stop_codon:yes gene_type:complete
MKINPDTIELLKEYGSYDQGRKARFLEEVFEVEECDFDRVAKLYKKYKKIDDCEYILGEKEKYFQGDPEHRWGNQINKYALFDNVESNLLYRSKWDKRGDKIASLHKAIPEINDLIATKRLVKTFRMYDLAQQMVSVLEKEVGQILQMNEEGASLKEITDWHQDLLEQRNEEEWEGDEAEVLDPLAHSNTYPVSRW